MKKLIKKYHDIRNVAYNYLFETIIQWKGSKCLKINSPGSGGGWEAGESPDL